MAASLVDEDQSHQPLKLSIDMDDSIAHFISPLEANAWNENTVEVLQLSYMFENRIVVWVLMHVELVTVFGSCFFILLGLSIAGEPRSSGVLVLYFVVLFVASFVLITQFWNSVLLVCTVMLAEYGLVHHNTITASAQAIECAAVFYFIWMAFICFSDAIPRLGSRVRLAASVLYVAEALRVWLTERIRSLVVSPSSFAPILRWCALENYSTSCLTAENVQFSARCSIAIYLLRQILVMVVNVWSAERDRDESHFLIIQLRLQLSHVSPTEFQRSRVSRFQIASNVYQHRRVAPQVVAHVPLTLVTAVVAPPSRVVVEITSPQVRLALGGWVGSVAEPRIPTAPATAVVVTTELDPNADSRDALIILSKFNDAFDDGISETEPLFGGTLFSWFHHYRLISLSTVLATFGALVISNANLNSWILFWAYLMMSLYVVFWVLVSFDRGMLRLLVTQFEHRFLMLVVVTYAVADVVQFVNDNEANTAYLASSPGLTLSNNIYSTLMWLVGTIVSISFDAHRGSRFFKLVVCCIWSVWNLFLFYNAVVVQPSQLVNGRAWLQTVKVCLGSECIDSQSIRSQCYVTIGIFCAKFFLSLFTRPNATVILKAPIAFRLQRRD